MFYSVFGLWKHFSAHIVPASNFELCQKIVNDSLCHFCWIIGGFSNVCMFFLSSAGKISLCLKSLKIISGDGREIEECDRRSVSQQEMIVKLFIPSALLCHGKINPVLAFWPMDKELNFRSSVKKYKLKLFFNIQGLGFDFIERCNTGQVLAKHTHFQK